MASAHTCLYLQSLLGPKSWQGLPPGISRWVASPLFGRSQAGHPPRSGPASQLTCSVQWGTGIPVPRLSVRKQRGSCLGAIPRCPCLGPGQPPRDSLVLCSYSLFTGEFPPLFLAVSIILPVPFAFWPPLAPDFLLNLQLHPRLPPCPSGPKGSVSPPCTALRAPSSGTPASARCHPPRRWRRRGG